MVTLGYKHMLPKLLVYMLELFKSWEGASSESVELERWAEILYSQQAPVVLFLLVHDPHLE